jgi:hypothetical protein
MDKAKLTARLKRAREVLERSPSRLFDVRLTHTVKV